MSQQTLSLLKKKNDVYSEQHLRGYSARQSYIPGLYGERNNTLGSFAI